MVIKKAGSIYQAKELFETAQITPAFGDIQTVALTLDRIAKVPCEPDHKNNSAAVVLHTIHKAEHEPDKAALDYALKALVDGALRFTPFHPSKHATKYPYLAEEVVDGDTVKWLIHPYKLHDHPAYYLSRCEEDAFTDEYQWVLCYVLDGKREIVGEFSTEEEEGILLCSDMKERYGVAVQALHYAEEGERPEDDDDDEEEEEE